MMGFLRRGALLCNLRLSVLNLSFPGNFLLVYGLPGQPAISRVQKLEKYHGIPVKFVLSSGAQHHMYLEEWY
jgi:hypothetical protein